MTEELSNLFERVKEKLKEKPLQVAEIFNEYFGEDRVEIKIPEVSNLSIVYALEYSGKLENPIEVVDNFQTDSLTEENEEELIYLLNEVLEDDESIDGFYYGFGEHTNITVYFPEVTITNENGESTKIKDLFVRTWLSFNGKFKAGPRLLRAHYTYAHFVNNYMHSHVLGIPIGGNADTFSDCCLGTGPILTTEAALRTSFDLDLWRQYCWDIDKYVTVESLSGVPYHKLKNCENEMSIGSEIRISDYMGSHLYTLFNGGLSERRLIVKDFIKYLIQSRQIKFNWANNMWNLAHSDAEFSFIVTKLFLQWMQESYPYLYSAQPTRYLAETIENEFRVVISLPTGIYDTGSSLMTNSDIDNYRGKHIITFKGREFNAVVDEPAYNITNLVQLKILRPGHLDRIKVILLTTLNTYYGRNKVSTSQE